MALKKLDLERLKPKLASFWPKGGPVWDGLGINVDTKERFLVEAKAKDGVERRGCSRSRH